jgi:ribosomal protein L40E
MDSSSNSYKEIKTIGIIQAVHVGILVGLCFINKSLVLFNPYTVIFWVLGPVVVGLYLITALKDPGYISINTQTPTKPVFSILNDENPSIEIENVVTIKDENAPSENLNNLSKENLVKTAKSEQDLDINIRICIQCKINQPYRSKHCRECKKCVALYDHHCPWIHGCVGQRNRIYFFWYLWFQCIELWYGGYFVIYI